MALYQSDTYAKGDKSQAYVNWRLDRVSSVAQY